MKAEQAGTILAITGTIVSCLGVIQNNLFLDHIAAMQVWRISNFVLLGWSFGLYRKWWDGGLAGLSLVGMYAFYCITNEWGLMHV